MKLALVWTGIDGSRAPGAAAPHRPLFKAAGIAAPGTPRPRRRMGENEAVLAPRGGPD
jgi:hypothetical protein